MNKINYTINLLIKDNNISTIVKKLEGNFNTLDNSVNKVRQTVNSVSPEIFGNITAVNTPVEQTANTIKYPLRRRGQVSDDPLPDYLGTNSLYSALLGNASCKKRFSIHGIS